MSPALLHRGALGLLLLLAACAQTPGVTPVPPPLPRPVVKAVEPPGPSQAQIRQARAERNRATNVIAATAAASGSGPSETLADYYLAIQQRLLDQSRLRRDRVPLDAPVDAESLARNFALIALRDEYGRGGLRLPANGNEAPLRRWQGPVRLQLEFGASSDTALQRAYRGEIAAFAARLQGASGHPVGLTSSRGNFIVLILSEDERRAIGPRLRRLIPDLPARDILALTELDPDNLCTVFAYSRGEGTAYVRAVALMRAELPGLLRSSCIHEELAQGMGLANDSPVVRPSIFNDDEEFALLTRHDELLLHILYDPRLRPGMTEAEAMPIVRRIAAELVP